MSPRYTDERLLNDLKLKAKILGRLPTKEEIDEDLKISKLRKITLQVIDILRNKGYQVEDMGEISTSTNIHLIINEKIKLSIKTSGIKKDQRQNYWKFHVKNNSVIQPDYLLLIGYKTEDFSDEGILFLVPFNDVKHIKTVSVNVDNMDNSKYAGYYVGSVNNIEL